MTKKIALKRSNPRIDAGSTGVKEGSAVSLLPHQPSVRNNTGGFYVKGHKRDTLMADYTKPRLNTDNPKKWFVYYNFRVPENLRDLYTRGTKRFKVYAGLNRLPDNERQKAADDLIAELSLALRNGWLNPFEVISEVATYLQKSELRSEKPARDALALFIQSREERKLDKTSIVAYQGTVDWLVTGIGDIPIGEVKYTDISATLNKTAADRKWSATTINKEWDFSQTVFNWLALEEYVDKNPLKGKVVKLPTDKTTHRWYDKETATIVKKAIRSSDTPWLINVCQFTYEILIRSKTELRNIKVGDIDMKLHRIAFRKEWTKNSSDQYRDYSDSFHQLVLDMGLDKLPKDWYIFGKSGKPGPTMAAHNYFSRHWEKIRSDIGLSGEYTIYGWKHTAVVHDMMKGVDGYTISHRARHGDTKTTDDYKRDYDITLNKVYDAVDLCF
jgi:hypothetical protein